MLRSLVLLTSGTVCGRACVHAFVHVCMCTCVHTCTRTYVYLYMLSAKYGFRLSVDFAAQISDSRSAQYSKDHARKPRIDIFGPSADFVAQTSDSLPYSTDYSP